MRHRGHGGVAICIHNKYEHLIKQIPVNVSVDSWVLNLSFPVLWGFVGSNSLSFTFCLVGVAVSIFWSIIVGSEMVRLAVLLSGVCPEFLQTLSNRADILLLQEHRLHTFEKHKLDDFLPDYVCLTKCFDDCIVQDPIMRHRGHGGSCRRNSRKLTFYKMHNKVCPQYLCNCLPPTVSSISDHNLRNNEKTPIPYLASIF
jgi:hypothetical protein